MAPEGFDREDERATHAPRQNTRQTERLDGLEGEYGEPIRQDWRSGRTTHRPRRSTTLPSSRDELAIWLQRGGWRMALLVAGVAAVVILALILIRPRQPLQASLTTPEAITDLNAEIPTLPDAATAASIQATEPATTTTTSGAKFKVFNTGDQGLFLRSDPNTNNQPLKTLPEGTIVTIVGEDSVQPDRVWKHVRDPDGTEGWVAADYVQAVQ